MISIAGKTGEALHAMFFSGFAFSLFDGWEKDINANMQKISKFSDDVSNALLGKLAKQQFDEVIVELEARQAVIGNAIRQSGISDEELQRRVATAKRLVETLALIKKVGPAPESNTSSIIGQENESLKERSTYTKDETEIAKLVLKSYTDRLHLQGALTSQILIATQMRITQLGIEEKAIDKLNRKLEIEKALSEEKRLQSRIGNDSLKLYDIAKTQGIEVARQIGEVLSGENDIASLSRRSDKTAFETFKTQFADLYKAKQGEMFFKGETLSGVQDLQGGWRIPIQEEAIRKSTLALPESETQKLQRLVNVNTSVPVNFNTTLDISKLDEVKKRFIAEVSKQLPQAGTEVNDALTKALLGKQGNNL
jgi:hypothetical protein